MKKYIKYIILSLMLFICAGAISSCHPQYFLDISVTGDELSDKNIDLLVKLRDRIDYIDRKECVFSGKPIIKITDDSEIAAYDTDGYRSIGFHYETAGYSKFPKDGNAAVSLAFNGKRDFKEWCKKCESFKIALIDNNGKILQISNKCKMEPKKNVFVDKINYDVSSNTLKAEYKYHRSSSLVLLETFFALLMTVMPISSLIGLGILIIKKSRKIAPLPTMRHCIICFLPCIPLLVYMGFRIDYALKMDRSVFSIFKEYFEKFDFGFALYYLIPVMVYAGMLIWYFVESSKNSGQQQENAQSHINDK